MIDRHRHPALCFRLALWALALVAFVQLVTAGVALAARIESAREVRVVEKVVPRIVRVPAEPVKAPEPAPPVVALPPPPPPAAAVSALPEARPLNAPPIADPVVERLVAEARDARVAEDMGAAIVKLEEARSRTPDDPNVLYEMGLVYEAMAAVDLRMAERAADAYQSVFELGTEGAGALYPLAAQKLRDGIERPRDMIGELTLGRVRIFKDDGYAAGERVVLTIPVNAAPGAEPSDNDFDVVVKFFNKTPNGDPHPAGPGFESDFRWVTGAADWLGGQELLRVTYVLPEQSEADTHLFGRQAYYGQVVELFYRNELIDVEAYPPHLASYSPGAPQGDPMFPEFLDQDLMPDGSLLPPLGDELPLPDIGLPPPER